MTDTNHIYDFKGIIFDLDGTLVNSEPLHLKAWNEITVKYGMPTMTWDYIQSVGGISTVNICRMICKEHNLDLDCVAVAKEKVELYKSKYMQDVPVHPYIASILKEAHDKDLKVAVATGSQQPETRFLLDKHGLLPYISAVISSDMVKNCKPAPDTYLEAAKAIGCEPKDCLVFEDTLIGLQGVKAAKMTCLRVFEGEIISDFIKAE